MRRDARGHLYVPTKTSDNVFLRFPEMLQGGHLLSWYHEILHARLSPVWSLSPSRTHTQTAGSVELNFRGGMMVVGEGVD